MDIDEKAAKRKIELAVAATEKGKIFFSTNGKKEEFNRGCDHVYGLLTDSHQLYRSGSFATSVFLSVTAIEEIAKLDIAVYRNEQRTTPSKGRRDDSLFNHKAKHLIALQETIAIGTRLPKAIGEPRVRELLNMAKSGKLLQLREAALYTDNLDGLFTCPVDRIKKQTARDILLLALEVWDDRLVGTTNYTYQLDAKLTPLFDEIASH